MREVLLTQDVRPDDIILENQAKGTHRNALFTRRIVEKSGWKSVILVAQYIHARRAFAIFRKFYGPEYRLFLALAYSSYERLPQSRLSSEFRFLFTWELPAFFVAKVLGWA